MILDVLQVGTYAGGVPEGWITVSEAAVILGIGEQRVRDLINAGRLKAEKVGEGRRGYWLIRPEDLKEVANRKPGRPRTKTRGRPPKS